MVNGHSGLSRHVEDVITAFMDDGGVNTLWQDPGERAWARPLVGFSSGGDPMWEALREVADPLHWTPAEAFAQAWPDMQPGPAELTVISWVLPQTEATRAENRSQTAFPSLRWARARTFGEEINNRLKVHLAASLKELGVEAVAPTLLPNFSWQNSPRFGFSSTWSERHAAFICGLGTFGLCDGLITPLGKAMRAGSVVARMRVPATPRPYTTHTQYCLFHSSGACMKCAQRCPAGAITEQGHDKEKCFNYIFGLVIPYIKEHYGFDGYSCGLCQTGVPCEAGIPATRRK